METDQEKMNLNEDEIKKIKNMKNYEVNKETVKLKGYDFFKIPIGLTNCIEKSYVQVCLDSLYDLFLNIQKKYSNESFIKVVIMIQRPDFSESQVIAFFNKQVYDIWFDRNSGDHKWIKGEKKNKLIEENPQFKDLKEAYFLEQMVDENGTIEKENDIWFYD